MLNQPIRRRPRGFTVVELLTVIAIIVLLISLLVPTLSSARESAKAGASKADLKALGDALTLFRNENPGEGRGNGAGFPPSARADDPTVAGSQFIFGAQWLYRYLSGPDGLGYIPEETVPRDLVLQGLGQSEHEQQDWYASEPTGVNPYAPLDRVGPYIDPGAIKSVMAAELPNSPFIVNEDGSFDPDPLIPVQLGLDESTYRAPVFLDRFDFPILYYAANPRLAERVDAPLAGAGFQPNDPRGIYTFMDNGLFTGACKGGLCVYTSWVYKEQESDIQNFGVWSDGVPDPNTILEDPKTFPYYILDKSNFESTRRPDQPGVMVPVRKSSFLLFTPGADGIFGTNDDVQNW